jgi:WD40 repeat protein
VSRGRRIGLGGLALLMLVGGGLGCRWWMCWPVQVALEQPGECWPLAFSPDGATLATTGWHQDISVWDLARGRKTATWARPPGCEIYDGAFSPDGRTFVAGWVSNTKPAPDFGLEVRDVATGQVRNTISTTMGFCSTLSFIDERTIRVALGRAGVVEVVDHDIASGRVLARRSLSCSDSGWWLFSRDGRF